MMFDMKNPNCAAFLALCISGFWFPLLAQKPVCGYEWFMERQDTVPLLRVSEANRRLESISQQMGNQLSPREDIVVPVVVHIVWNSPEENISDERVFSQIEVLNRDFNGENADLADAPEDFRILAAQKGIRFCLAAEGPQGGAVSGITRTNTSISAIGTKSALYSTASGGSDAWDTKRYFNIWVANTGEFLTGFGTYPGQVEPEKEGMVVHPKYFGKNNSKRYNIARVAVHEAGHYFGLQHTWGDDEDCSTDDGVEDTPFQLAPYLGCPAHPQVSCGSPDMFMDFMDYVDDDCMVMFTQGQMDRMWRTIEIFRPGLTTSEVSCVHTKNKEPKTTFSVFPNPAKRVLNINFKERISEIGGIEIYNSIGQKVDEIETVLFDGMKVDLPEMPKGLYWIKIKSYMKKFAAL